MRWSLLRADWAAVARRGSPVFSRISCAPSALRWREAVPLSSRESPARRARCGAPRLRATRGGRHWVKGASRGPAAFGVSSRGFAGRAFRPVLVSARRSFGNATPAARRRAPRDTPQRARRAARCGCALPARGQRAVAPRRFAGVSRPMAKELFGPNQTRGAWAGGGVPRGATVRRRACQLREGSGPGGRSREAPPPAQRRQRSESAGPQGTRHAE